MEPEVASQALLGYIATRQMKVIRARERGNRATDKCFIFVPLAEPLAHDVIKAIALGASAVLLRRPYMWSLALGGEQGVREVLANFLADLDLTLALSGYREFGEVDGGTVVRAVD